MAGAIFVVAMFVLIAGFVAYDMIQRPKRLKAAQEQDARRGEEVRRRGWKLEVERGPREVSYDYSGTEEGIPWKFELRSWEAGRGSTRQDRVSSRWFTESVKTRGGILLIWPSFGMPQDVSPTSVPPFVMKLMLTPLINALGAQGPEADLITNASPVVPDDPLLRANYLLRATDPAAMNRFLDAGARATLIDAAPWLPVREGANHLIIAALSESGLTILVSGWVNDVELLSKVVRAGAELSRAWQSGQRFS
ncbi:MAG TPA: hypothetical protein VFM36_17455 [Thermoanaerobaculia bacterium]|nr:hypothetical protein [Thermoanaerobaculia bacterium]